MCASRQPSLAEANRNEYQLRVHTLHEKECYRATTFVLSSKNRGTTHAYLLEYLKYKKGLSKHETTLVCQPHPVVASTTILYDLMNKSTHALVLKPECDRFFKAHIITAVCTCSIPVQACS